MELDAKILSLSPDALLSQHPCISMFFDLGIIRPLIDTTMGFFLVSRSHEAVDGFVVVIIVRTRVIETAYILSI